VQARWRTASREELIKELERQERELERQRQEIERLRREHERADRDRDRYRRDRDQLRKRIDRLEDDLDRAKRELHRQAAPFSRGTPQRAPRRAGRKPDGHFAPRVHRILQRALRVRDRYRAGDVSPHGLAVARGHFERQLNALIEDPGARHVVQRFATHLAIEFPAVFTFLDLIEATNWRAEHALRPAVVTRKVCRGNRSVRGAHTQEVLASVLRTMPQRQLDAGVLLPQLLQQRQPAPVLPPLPAAE
jgi:hypothetical protein